MCKLKPFNTYKEQISKLSSRGCIITDYNFCEKILKDIGYYRLSAYFLPFKYSDETYHQGLTFDKIYRIYEFDRKLRSILLSAIEVIEVSLRARIAYLHSGKYGPLGYLDKTAFKSSHNSKKFKDNITREIESNKNSPYVRHHINKYGGQFPLWVISELFTFGMISHFYKDLKTADKKVLAGSRHHDMVSWLRCCTDLRNICAHYGRLYYRIFTAIPKYLDENESAKRRLWGAILVVRELYPSVEEWNTEFMPKIASLFRDYESDIELNHIGFPDDWKKKLMK